MIEMFSKENILKQSRQDDDPSDNVVDVAGFTSADSPEKETDKSHIQDAGIEQLSDIVVEEMKPIETIIPVREYDMTLTVYKPPPTTPNEYLISDTAIVSTFPTPKKGLWWICSCLAEYLSEGLGIPSSIIDAQYHRWRYAGLLYKYGSEKAENGYFSENDDPPRPRSGFSTKEKDCVLHIQ
ncbi:hypothetical protein FXO37_26476 [Capsicum annuum]|nr:hypothetical protein FXO37_26476 [Capsicum annuum]